MKETKVKQIKELKRKAEVTRNAHFLLSSKYKLLNGWVHFFTLMSASVVAVLTFADFNVFLPVFPKLSPEDYKLWITGVASFVFLLTVAEEFLRLASKAAIHESPAKQLTTFIRTASAIQEYEVIKDEDIDRLTLQYTMICDSAPEIPDSIFYKAKQNLLRKIEISKALEKNPFMSIWIFSCLKRLEQIAVNWNPKKRKDSDITS